MTLPDEEPEEDYQTENLEWAILALVVTGVLVTLCFWGVWFS